MECLYWSKKMSEILIFFNLQIQLCCSFPTRGAYQVAEGWQTFPNHLSDRIY